MKKTTLGIALMTIAAIGCSQSTPHSIVFQSQPHPQIMRSAAGPVRIAIKKIDASWDVRQDSDMSFLPPEGYSWEWIGEDGRGRTLGAYRFVPASTGPRSAEAEFWATKLQNAIAFLLREHGGSKVRVIGHDRIDYLREDRNLRLANLVESTGDPEKMKWSNTDAYITGNISGLTTIQKEIKSSGWSGLAYYIPIFGSVLSYELGRPKPYYRRTMTISGRLELINAANGNVVAVHEISAQHHEDKKSYPFADASRLSMVPEEQLIRRLLNAEVREFCGRLVPVDFERTYMVKSSHNEDSKAGVQKLRAGETLASLEAFRRAVAADAGDHRSHFGAGVACEELGRLSDAAEHYRAALMQLDDDPDKHEAQYETALKNVEKRT